MNQIEKVSIALQPSVYNTFRALNIFFNPEDYKYKIDTPFHKLEGSQGGSVFPNILVDFLEGVKKISIERNDKLTT